MAEKREQVLDNREKSVKKQLIAALHQSMSLIRMCLIWLILKLQRKALKRQLALIMVWTQTSRKRFYLSLKLLSGSISLALKILYLLLKILVLHISTLDNLITLV